MPPHESSRASPPPRIPLPRPGGGSANHPRSPAPAPPPSGGDARGMPRCASHSAPPGAPASTSCPRRGQATHDGEVVPALPLVDDGRQSCGSIALNHSRQEVEAGLIHENQRPTFPLRPPLQLGPRFGAPALDDL